MLNQFVIVGRLVNSPELRKVEKGNVTELNFGKKCGPIGILGRLPGVFKDFDPSFVDMQDVFAI